MKISEAILRYRIYYMLGYAMWLGTLLVYAVSFLTFVYWQGVELGGLPGFGIIFQAMGKLAYSVFAATYPYTSFIWDHALTINQGDPLSYGNLALLGLVGVAMLGVQIIKMARSLRSRVKAALRRAEESGWRTAPQQGFSTTINATQVAQVNVYNQALPTNSKDSGWLDRPLVKFALGILASYLVAILVKLTGVA
jgi:xanthosine utilization system XapX-like protein